MLQVKNLPLLPDIETPFRPCSPSSLQTQMPPQCPVDPAGRIAEFWRYAPDRSHAGREAGTKKGRPMMRPPQISANLSVGAASP
jgi:hypothetical protein